MPLDPSISLNIKPVDTMSKLSDMLGVAQGAQAYQSNQLNLTKARALLQPEINQGIANSQSAQAKAQVDTANVQPLIQQQQAYTSQQQTAAQKAKFNLTGEQMQKGMDIATSLIQDPDIAAGKDSEAIINKLTNARQHMKDYGIPPAMAEASTADLISLAHKNPGAVRQELANRLMIGQGASGQAAQDLVPAGQQQGIGSDVNGNRTLESKTQFGGQQPTQAMPTANGAPATPPQNAYAPGDSAQVAGKYQDERKAVNDAAANVGAQHDSNRQIVSLLSTPGVAAAGGGSHWLASVLGHVGLQATNDYATDFNSVNHLLALQTQNNEKAMGVSTDAGRATASAATGSQEMDTKSLMRATKLNDATATGLDMYNKGMERRVQATGGNNFAVRDFKNDWSRAYSTNGPLAMRYFNAVQQGNQADAQAALDEAGKPGSKGYKALFGTLNNLKSLINTGSLPHGR